MEPEGERMTYQEAHEHLENLQREMTNHRFAYSNELINANGMAILAIEKQIPKKPIHKRKNYYCPICKEDGWVLWDDVKPNAFNNFCGRCGQAIDWGDE